MKCRFERINQDLRFFKAPTFRKTCKHRNWCSNSKPALKYFDKHVWLCGFFLFVLTFLYKSFVWHEYFHHFFITKEFFLPYFFFPMRKILMNVNSVMKLFMSKLNIKWLILWFTVKFVLYKQKNLFISWKFVSDIT